MIVRMFASGLHTSIQIAGFMYCGHIDKHLKNVRKTAQLNLQARSTGNSLPTRISSIGTCFPNLSTEPTVGKFPSESMITTRCNRAEVVFLRLEANCASSSIKSSRRSHLKNASVFSCGGKEGFENMPEKRWDIRTSRAITNVSREGKNDMSNTSPCADDLWCMRRNSRTFVSESKGNSLKYVPIKDG